LGWFVCPIIFRFLSQTNQASEVESSVEITDVTGLVPEAGHNINKNHNNDQPQQHDNNNNQHQEQQQKQHRRQPAEVVPVSDSEDNAPGPSNPGPSTMMVYQMTERILACNGNCFAVYVCVVCCCDLCNCAISLIIVCIFVF
jgi:ABC-type Zn2+ transport system substrate-binding protein/surface adhesin